MSENCKEEQQAKDDAYNALQAQEAVVLKEQKLLFQRQTEFVEACILLDLCKQGSGPPPTP